MPFVPWRCTCLCPAIWAWDPARHETGCGAFVPDDTHDDEGGSD